MAERDVDVNLNVMVKGEDKVGSLGKSLDKLNKQAKTTTTGTNKSLNDLAKNVNATAGSVKTNMSQLADAAKPHMVRQLYAAHRKERAERLTDAAMAKASAVFAKVKERVVDATSEIGSVLGSLASIAFKVGGVVLSLAFAITKLAIIATLVGGVIAFAAAIKLLKSSFAHAREWAQMVLKVAPMAERQQMTLTEAMNDSIAGTALLGKAYDDLNESAADTFKKMKLTTKQTTGKGGQRATILDLVQYLSQRYQGMRDSLDKAKTEKEKSRIKTRMAKFRDTLKDLPSEAANMVLSWAPDYIESFRGAVDRLGKKFAQTGPQRTDKEWREASQKLEGEIALIKVITAKMGVKIGQWSIEPIGRALEAARLKFEKISAPIADLVGAISAKAWEGLGALIDEIDVQGVIDKLRQWTVEVQAMTPAEVRAKFVSIKDTMTAIGEAIKSVVNAFSQLAAIFTETDTTKLNNTALFIQGLFEGNFGKMVEAMKGKTQQERWDLAHFGQFAPPPEAEIQLPTKAVPLGKRPGALPPTVGPNILGAQLGSDDIDKLAAAVHEQGVVADSFGRIVNDGANSIKTSGEAMGAKLKTSMTDGTAIANQGIVNAFTTGAPIIASAITGALAGAKISIIAGGGAAVSRGPDLPAPQ